MNELLPCPFCGRNDSLLIQRDDESSRITCDACGASSAYTDRGDHYELWNDRAPVARELDASGEAYAKANPLGGPATMFEAIAQRLRAGENYDEVLADYGLTRAAEAGGQCVDPVPCRRGRRKRGRGVEDDVRRDSRPGEVRPFHLRPGSR